VSNRALIGLLAVAGLGLAGLLLWRAYRNQRYAEYMAQAGKPAQVVSVPVPTVGKVKATK
jgi:hypothetical protein